jgi:hypothetical protein
LKLSSAWPDSYILGCKCMHSKKNLFYLLFNFLETTCSSKQWTANENEKLIRMRSKTHWLP